MQATHLVVTIIQVDELEWDEDNEAHCLDHGLSPLIADEVRTAAPLFFPNKAGKTASVLWLAQMT
jgi:hypothetical protein